MGPNWSEWPQIYEWISCFHQVDPFLPWWGWRGPNSSTKTTILFIVVINCHRKVTTCKTGWDMEHTRICFYQLCPKISHPDSGEHPILIRWLVVVKGKYSETFFGSLVVRVCRFVWKKTYFIGVEILGAWLTVPSPMPITFRQNRSRTDTCHRLIGVKPRHWLGNS